MNAMGHNVKNFIGVPLRDLTKKIDKLVPDYHPMGSAGMAAMGSMEMAMPDNTLPMMTGFGQFGPVEMGGMFTLVKVREGLERDNYADPGPYRHPPGTVAHEVEASPDALANVPRASLSARHRPFPARSLHHLRHERPDLRCHAPAARGAPLELVAGV